MWLAMDQKKKKLFVKYADLPKVIDEKDGTYIWDAADEEYEIVLVKNEALYMPITLADIFMDVIGTLHADLGFSLEHALQIAERYLEKGGVTELLEQFCKLRAKVIQRNKAYMKRRAQKYEDQGQYQCCVVCHAACQSHCNYCKQAGVKTYVCHTCMKQVKGTCHPWLMCVAWWSKPAPCTVASLLSCNRLSCGKVRNACCAQCACKFV